MGLRGEIGLKYSKMAKCLHTFVAHCRYIKRLPKISANRDMYPGLNSTRQILKQYGRGSGLVMALKETINSRQWINAWINLLFTGVSTWMYVTAIVWKKREKKDLATCLVLFGT